MSLSSDSLPPSTIAPSPLSLEPPVLVSAKNVTDQAASSTSYASLYVAYKSDKRQFTFDVTLPTFSRAEQPNLPSTSGTDAHAEDSTTIGHGYNKSSSTTVADHPSKAHSHTTTTTIKSCRLVQALNVLAVAGFLLAQDELDRLLAYCHPNDASFRANGQKCFFLLTKCPQVNVSVVE